MPLGPEVAEQIRFGLEQLRARNGFHEFETLCLDFANATLGGHYVPATGPVGAGGDHGRDFSSHMRMVQQGPGLIPAGEIVAICTTQAKRVDEKIRSDLRKVASGRPVTAVYAFITADMPVDRIERLKRHAETAHGITLEVFDGRRLSYRMAWTDFAETAYRRLHLDQRSLSAAMRATEDARRWSADTMPGYPELHDYLQAIRQACGQHPWPLIEHVPDLGALYQPQALTAADGTTRTWQQAMERSPHLWISGPAGAGKSSLLHHLAATLADRWLDRDPQPWLPVPIQARELAGDTALTKALSEGVGRTLGGLLHRPLEADFFDRELPKAQWLVLVDGLDEIRDRDKRNAALLVATLATRHSSMRFVITTRPGATETVPNTFTTYALAPFEKADVQQYLARWHKLPGHAAMTTQRTSELINLLDRGTWQPTPLVLVMICMLVGTDVDNAAPTTLDGIYSTFAARLVTRLTQTGESTVDDLQNHIHTLLEKTASHRLFEDPDADLLNVVVATAAEHGITPPAPLAADWNQTVADILLRSGLITRRGTELEFLHSSFEEYYAVRALPNPTPGGVRNTLASLEASFDDDLDLVLVNLDLLEFLLDRTDDVDAAVAAVVTAYPGAAAALVRHFKDWDLGEQTVAALKAILADDSSWLERDVQAHVASALGIVKPDEGLPYLLALSIDLDLEESERLTIINDLVHRGGRVAAAIQWLTFETLDDTGDYAWQLEAAPLVTSLGVSDDDRARGLQLIAQTKALADRHRIAACCDLVKYDHKVAYHLTRQCTEPRWFVMDVADTHRSWWPTLVRQFVLDDSVTFGYRVSAIEYVEDDDRVWAADLYNSLKGSASLTEEQRNAVSAAVKRLAATEGLH